MITSYETEMHIADTAMRVGHAMMKRGEYAGKKKDASQHTRLFASKRKQKKGKKEDGNNKEKKQKDKNQKQLDAKRETERHEIHGKKHNSRPATSNKADEAMQPTSGAATVLGFE